MANYIPFQPVIFDESLDACLANTNGFSMPVLAGDNTQFQFTIDGCTQAEQMIANNSFSSSSSWLLGSNWSIASGYATHTTGVDGVLQQLFTFSSANSYKISIGVQTLTSGSLEVKLGIVTIGVITAPGNYDFYNYTGSGSSSGISLYASSDLQCSLSSVSCYLLYRKQKVIIYNADTNTASAILDVNDGYFNYNQNYWTTTIDWDALGLTYGCYYIGIADECLNTCSQLYLAGQSFYESSFWAQQPLNATLTLLNNYWLYEGTGGSSALLTANNLICSGKRYKITYTLAGHAGDALFQLSVGSVNGALRGADGTYTEYITSAGTSFSLSFASTVNPSNFWITGLSVEVMDEYLTSDYYSNKFLYTDNVNCSHMITMVCDENSLGMGFVDTGFIPRARVESKLILSGYPQERVKTKTSQGEKRIDFFTSDKNWRLKVIHQPEHIIDFLSTLIGCDHWYIDDVEYFASEDEFAEPRSNKWFSLYDIDIECQKKTLLLQNKNCSDNKQSGQLAEEEITTTSGREMTTGSNLPMVIYSRQ